MIDNIILLITGTLHQRPISELIPKCHPLGSFEQMEAIHVAATPAELYNAVLVDTPLGKLSHSGEGPKRETGTYSTGMILCPFFTCSF
jgi:vacuolar-type H+-ATPase subunit C/Vma6